MKILHVCAIFHDVSNGPSFSVPEMVKALNQHDHENDLLNLTHSRASRKIVEEYKFHYQDYSSFRFKQFEAYDLVIFHQFWEKKYVGFGFYCRLKHIPYVIVPHGSLTRKALKRKWLKKLFFSPLYVFFLFGAKKLHYLTENEKNVSLDFGKVFFVAPNGISVAGSKMVSKYIYPGRYKRILFLGRLDPFTKGLDRLLIGLSKIKEQLKQARYKVELYGSDNPKGGKLKLQRMLNKLSLQEIVCIHDPVYGREKEEVIRSSTFFVLPSRTEGHPLSAIECLSYGIPGVVTPETNIAKEIEQCDCGIIVKGKIEDAVLSAISINSLRYQLLTKHSKKMCEEKFSWQHIAFNLSKEYLKLKK